VRRGGDGAHDEGGQDDGLEQHRKERHEGGVEGAELCKGSDARGARDEEDDGPERTPEEDAQVGEEPGERRAAQPAKHEVVKQAEADRYDDEVLAQALEDLSDDGRGARRGGARGSVAPRCADTEEDEDQGVDERDLERGEDKAVLHGCGCEDGPHNGQAEAKVVRVGRREGKEAAH
jgi:hypothetical protein